MRSFRLEAMCIEPLSFENLLCQMLDLIHPVDSKFVTLVDLKRKIELVHIFFDTFFDLEKYLDHENKDSFAVAAQKVGHVTRFSPRKVTVLSILLNKYHRRGVTTMRTRTHCSDTA